MKNTYFKFILPMIVVLTMVTTSVSQDARQPSDGPKDQLRPPVSQPQDGRANALRQLGLSPEQIRQIRMLNAERRPLMEAAQQRFRRANRALDEAVYADQVNESDVQSRLQEAQLAQAEVVKVRFMNELAVRRILTQDQLVRFRELRQRFEQTRQTIERQRPLNKQTPFNRQLPANQFDKSRNLQMPVKRLMRPDQQKRNF